MFSLLGGLWGSTNEKKLEEDDGSIVDREEIDQSSSEENSENEECGEDVSNDGSKSDSSLPDLIPIKEDDVSDNETQSNSSLPDLIPIEKNKEEAEENVLNIDSILPVVKKEIFEFEPEPIEEEKEEKPSERLQTQYKIHEYFNNLHNLTNSDRKDKMKNVLRDDFYSNSKFALVGKGTVFATVKYDSEELIELFKNKEINENNDHWYISNITINGADIDKFEHLSLYANGECIDKINSNTFDLASSYYNLNKGENYFQLPLSGTFNKNRLYLGNNTEYCINVKTLSDEVDENLQFTITYDIHQGPKPQTDKLMSVIESQLCAYTPIGGKDSHMKSMIMHDKAVLYFNYPVLGIRLKFKEGNLLDIVKSITLKIKLCGGYEHFEVIDLDMLKEFKGTFGEGIIPFVPKFKTTVDSLRYAFDFSVCDVSVLEFDLIDDSGFYELFTDAMNFNLIKYNEESQPEPVYDRY